MPIASRWVPPTTMDDNWTFRTGIAFDDSPVPADKRSISIPDQDRLWLSAGATYAFNEGCFCRCGRFLYARSESDVQGRSVYVYL